MQAVIPFPEIDPVLVSFEIFGMTLAIRWYALAYIAGFLLAWRWIVWQIRRPQLWPNNTPPMSEKNAEDLLTWMVIGTILGGRLGYVLFYNFQQFLVDPMAILRVWEGGMSFHGGFIGVIVSGILFCNLNKLPAWSVGDAIASSACFGLFFGRIANFINAELWGRPTDMPWGFAFPGQAAQDCGLVLISEICARHPSQLYEAALEGVVLFAIMCWMMLRRDWLKFPGAMIGLFFAGYGVARFIVEGFRQGDAQFTSLTNPWGHVIRFGSEVSSLGLSMGQILSLPMILIGCYLVIRAKPKL